MASATDGRDATGRYRDSALASAVVPGERQVGIISALPDLLTELGCPPAPVLADAGIDPAILRDPDNVITFVAAGRLLASAAAASGCAHIGLLLGQRGVQSHPSHIRRLMRNAPNFGTAIRDLCANQPRFVRGAVTYLAIRDDIALWGYMIYAPGIPGVEHLVDSGVTIGIGMMRELSGNDPADVLMTRPVPVDAGPYRRLFGITPRFGAEQNALIFPRTLLATPVPGADPVLRRILEKSVADFWALRQPTFTERVERSLHADIMFGPVSLDSAAKSLGMHARTLKRRLRAEGSSFSALLAKVRFEMAAERLRATSVPITEIAFSLGYGDPSAFTHAFRRWSGKTPSEVRGAV